MYLARSYTNTQTNSIVYHKVGYNHGIISQKYCSSHTAFLQQRCRSIPRNMGILLSLNCQQQHVDLLHFQTLDSFVSTLLRLYFPSWCSAEDTATQTILFFSATSPVLFPDTILAEQSQNLNASISCLYLNQWKIFPRNRYLLTCRKTQCKAGLTTKGFLTSLTKSRNSIKGE